MNDGIGFLIGDVSRMMRRRFDERARTIGVTRPQWRALVTLAREEGLQQGVLAERIEVEPITLCRMIDRLAEAGMVERRRDPADRRAWNIYLTDRSRPLLDRLGAVADDLVAAALDGVEDHDSAVLTATLERMRANLSTESPARETANG
ncbi:MarR family winged helix-turn-helix transcriptional regulator [Sphingomonas sp.]|uniref:MarR family winged helix-turn-helix transcriptional regulator n=1 Tax=Sphingomonas sp. TaxID=28214 RepID=UPI0035BC0F72